MLFVVEPLEESDDTFGEENPPADCSSGRPGDLRWRAQDFKQYLLLFTTPDKRWLRHTNTQAERH